MPRSTTKKSASAVKKTKKMKYSKETLSQALTEIKNGVNNVNAVSVKYEIPVTTLMDKIKNMYSCNKPGRLPTLSEKQENELVEWIFDAVKKGFPVTKFELNETVKNICIRLKKPNFFVNNTPGRKWYDLFIKRHPNVVSRVSETVDLGKANVTEESLRSWYSQVKEYLVQEKLMDITDDRVFNTDETGKKIITVFYVSLIFFIIYIYILF